MPGKQQFLQFNNRIFDFITDRLTNQQIYCSGPCQSIMVRFYGTIHLLCLLVRNSIDVIGVLFRLFFSYFLGRIINFMETESAEIKLIEFKKFRHATLYWIQSHPHVALIVANVSYIPIENFKDAFLAMEPLVTEKKITKLIFDKTQMRVFHQPSMEWYFVEWKERMADLGLVNHVKILPEDYIFSQSVKIGRGLIDNKYPKARFHQLSIQYASTVEEAILL